MVLARAARVRRRERRATRATLGKVTLAIDLLALGAADVDSLNSNAAAGDSRLAASSLVQAKNAEMLRAVSHVVVDSTRRPTRTALSLLVRVLGFDECERAAWIAHRAGSLLLLRAR
jgi:hypothetical protein